MRSWGKPPRARLRLSEATERAAGRGVAGERSSAFRLARKISHGCNLQNGPKWETVVQPPITIPVSAIRDYDEIDRVSDPSSA
jgi:hypothetical protein